MKSIVKGKGYKVQLYNYSKSNGFDERKVIVVFDPRKVDGFGVVQSQRKADSGGRLSEKERKAYFAKGRRKQ